MDWIHLDQNKYKSWAVFKLIQNFQIP